MIDLDDFEYEIKCVPDNECALVTKGEAFELIDRLRQAEKDAARYRWLRDELNQSQGGVALFDGCCHVCDVDLFIDEAMK